MIQYYCGRFTNKIHKFDILRSTEHFHEIACHVGATLGAKRMKKALPPHFNTLQEAVSHATDKTRDSIAFHRNQIAELEARLAVLAKTTEEDVQFHTP